LELGINGKVALVAGGDSGIGKAILCSQQSSFVVGFNYRVDGGSVASMAV
jgi:hypothetical protein